MQLRGLPGRDKGPIGGQPLHGKGLVLVQLWDCADIRTFRLSSHFLGASGRSLRVNVR